MNQRLRRLLCGWWFNVGPLIDFPPDHRSISVMVIRRMKTAARRIGCLVPVCQQWSPSAALTPPRRGLPSATLQPHPGRSSCQGRFPQAEAFGLSLDRRCRSRLGGCGRVAS